MANVGMVGLDWQERVNWDRLRKYRLERAAREIDSPVPGKARRAALDMKLGLLDRPITPAVLEPLLPRVLLHNRGLHSGGWIWNRRYERLPVRSARTFFSRWNWMRKMAVRHGT